ncbi:MAG: thioredoxin fold domain-containing protein [Planctomycetes bacterium]|nr:thioredoxin fold domain-containing protein [Planctomycetota bacterium]
MARVLRVGLMTILAAGMATVIAWQFQGESSSAAEPAPGKPAVERTGVPKLVDLGSTECIPCKLMAPALEEIKKEFAGKLAVEFADVGKRENVALARQYGIRLIPTQVFLDTEGKELWRHEGFISRYGILDKFRELGYAFAAESLKPAFSRLEPAGADDRPKDKVCQFCDGDVDAKTAVAIKTDKGDVKLCSPHCWFIMYSCLTQDKTGFDARASVTDWTTGKLIPMATAVYLYGLEEKTGRPTIKAFADRVAAEAEQKTAGGSLVGYEVLKQKELAPRCGFCDRAVYAEDAAMVKIDGVHSWGCCSHCAMGVAARTGKSIEVHQRDRLTGEMIVVRTLGGYIQSIEPATAVAWFGKRRTADGSYISAGCFHQGFFTSLENLKKWADQNPAEIGNMITIDQALGDKMRMSPAQIAKACKMGECAPK